MTSNCQDRRAKNQARRIPGYNGGYGQLVTLRRLRLHRPIAHRRSDPTRSQTGAGRPRRGETGPTGPTIRAELAGAGFGRCGQTGRGRRPFDLVFHAAGPFTITSDPMLRACLAGVTHYVDITGEIGVFDNTFRYSEPARQKELVFMSGAGFDVIPSDCLVNYVADQLPNAAELELAIVALGSASAGTTNTMLELLPALETGSMVRRNGRYQPYPIGQGAKKVTFSNGRTRTVMPLPWGDLATAYRSTASPTSPPTWFCPFRRRRLACFGSIECSSLSNRCGSWPSPSSPAPCPAPMKRRGKRDVVTCTPAPPMKMERP